MTDETYSAMPGIRWTHLKRMATSPMHYRAAVDGMFGSGETRALRLGRAIHAMLLEPDVFQAQWVCWSGQRRGKAWEAFKTRHVDREILTYGEMAMVVNCSAAIRRHPYAEQHLEGAREVAISWLDQHTGLRCKARIDLLTATRLCDVKSTTQIDPWPFGKLAARLGYHGQLAFYLDGLVANGIAVEPEPLIIAVEVAVPFDVVPYELSLPVVEAGRREYQRLLLQVAECQARGEWLGRSPLTAKQLELPESAYGGFDDGLDEVEAGAVFE